MATISGHGVTDSNQIVQAHDMNPESSSNSVAPVEQRPPRSEGTHAAKRRKRKHISDDPNREGQFPLSKRALQTPWIDSLPVTKHTSKEQRSVNIATGLMHMSITRLIWTFAGCMTRSLHMPVTFFRLYKKKLHERH